MSEHIHAVLGPRRNLEKCKANRKGYMSEDTQAVLGPRRNKEGM